MIMQCFLGMTLGWILEPEAAQGQKRSKVPGREESIWSAGRGSVSVHRSVLEDPPALQRSSFEGQAYAGSVYIKQSMEQVHSLSMYTLRGLEGTA